jgi:hypothetical protein
MKATNPSARLSALDAQRESFILQLAPLLRYASDIKMQETNAVTHNLDLAVPESCWTDLVQVTASGLDVSAQIPLRETLALMARRIALLEEAQTAAPKKKVATEKPGKKKKVESVWNESMFNVQRAKQLTASSDLAALKGEGKRGQVLAEVIDYECRFVNDLLVAKGICEAALREQAKRHKPFITDDELDILFPPAFNQVLAANEALFAKLSGFTSASSLMGPLLCEFATLAVRPYTDYVIAFEKISEKLKDLQNARPALADFLRGCKSHPQCLQRDLISLLVMPVQHLPRIELLAKELQKKTPEDHEDYAELNRAISAVLVAGQRVNTDKGKSDDFESVSELCTQTLGECYLTKLLSHSSQKITGRRILHDFKASTALTAHLTLYSRLHLAVKHAHAFYRRIAFCTATRLRKRSRSGCFRI